MGSSTPRSASRASTDTGAPPASLATAASGWWIVPGPLLDRITQLRHRDGHRAWSYESIGDRIGRTGASVRKIVTGQTRQPDLDVVDALATLLDLHPTRFTAGSLPSIVPTASPGSTPVAAAAKPGGDELGWLGDPLLAAIDRITDPTARHVLDNLICTHLRDAPTTATRAAREPWSLDAARLDAAITRAGLPNRRLASAVGISERAIRKLRAGQVRRPNLIVVSRLADQLGVPVADLTIGDVPQLSFPSVERSRTPLSWLSDEAWLGLACLTDPSARAAVERSIRLYVEFVARRPRNATH